jgi:uncharacterized protein Yka (UPF0111/DUF47 family)
MNINESYAKSQSSPDEVMDAIQSVLFEMVIEPMQKKLNIDDFKALDMIGETLKAIAEKATAYDHLNKTGLDQNYKN